VVQALISFNSELPSDVGLNFDLGSNSMNACFNLSVRQKKLADLNAIQQEKLGSADPRS